MITDRIAELIARRLSKEATPQELQELDAYMQANPSDQYFNEILSSYWNSKPGTADQPVIFSDEHFNHIIALADETSAEPGSSAEVISANGIRRRTWIKRLGIAAVTVGILIGAWVLYPHKSKIIPSQNDTENEESARKGARSKLVLPDGSKVWLNSETKLTYPKSFTAVNREVKLEGEAFFEVVKDAKRPFIVHTSGIDIRVLGTAFNVKSYTADSTIEATLIRGMIEIVKKNQPGEPMLILRPHEKLVYNKFSVNEPKNNTAAPPVNIIPANAAILVTKLPKNIADTSIVETSWIYDKLLFDGEKFDQLAVRMERWFNVRITFKNDKVANYRLRGSFVNETVDEALQALQLSVAFNYKISGDEIEIDKK